MILVFTFVHLIVSAIEREQFIIDYNVGDVEYKDITVLHCKAHNHFQHYYALVDSDTAVVISLRSQQADTMVGKTIKKVPLRQLHSYNIPFWAAETNNLNIGYFNCKGDTIYFDRAKNKIYLRDDERIKILKWRKTVTPEGDTIEVSEEYPSKRRKAIGSISYNRASIDVYLNKDDFEGAKRDYNTIELINELYQFNPSDTISSRFSYWYSHMDAAKIPVLMRNTSYEYNIKYICSNKIKALAWIIMIYLDEPFKDKFMVFSNSNNRIFDYYCCKYINGKKDEDGTLRFPQAFFVKNESEGYPELMKEIGEWVELVNINGIDYVRKNGIAPLKTINYEIIPFKLITPD